LAELGPEEWQPAIRYAMTRALKRGKEPHRSVSGMQIRRITTFGGDSIGRRLVEVGWLSWVVVVK
ncbi:MAG: hypothetical protein ACREXR_00515, partial [Gammaproteobacteria bacterium]